MKNEYSRSSQVANVFGVKLSLHEGDVDDYVATLRALWELAYGQQLSDLRKDLELCREYFDPVARGHRLRERLSQLPAASADLAESARGMTEPLVVRVANDKFLVGVEGRLLLELLGRRLLNEVRPDIVLNAVNETQLLALVTYRRWTRHRLDQVVALRDGRGTEVMQAKSVGIVLALLVNRSTGPDRAIGRLADGNESRRVDEALHEAAAAFAGHISNSRPRSHGEQRLSGGHWLTEARRRLAHRLVVTKSPRGSTSYIYIPEDSRDEVIQFLARDLARRNGLTAATIGLGFDDLVKALRGSAMQLAGHDMIFERPGETKRLREKLLTAFLQAQESGPSDEIN